MRTARPVLATTAAALLLTLTACSGSGGGDTADTQAPEMAASEVDADTPAPSGVADDSAYQSGGGDSAGSVAREASYQDSPPEQQAVIRNGSVSLRSKDVGQVRFDVQELVDQYGGQVTDNKTETDRSGSPLRSRMVLRVPSTDFDEVMDRLAKLATLASTTSSSEDVTTQVIDVDARIAVQERSVRRVRQLLDQARSIRDIMSIENELAERQAALDSLKQQQAWLADQTSQATIKVHIERTTKTPPPPEETNGFVAGLKAGWHGLRTAFVGASTVLGAVLPFALVALVVGGPILLVWRKRRRTVPVAPADAGAAGA